MKPFKVDLDRNPIAHVVYWEVLYPAVEARDKRAGREVAHSLVHPDPWVIALATVMWEGIMQGLSWDTVKLAVRRALSVMQREGVAPADNYSRKKRTKTELGFCWTEYKNGKKQYHMFMGLRRTHKEHVKRSRGKS